MRPLDGIVVLDLSRILAGPYCSMLMSDMGATVIKVEEPSSGDDTRGFGPPFHGDQSAYFLSVNRNKKSLALNMKAAAARDILDKLVGKADVLLENFRPGAADRLGMGYERLSAMNPRLVYASVSGYGQTGPESQRPGYDVVLQGLGGIMSLTGHADGPPYKMGVSQADLVAGMNAFQGVLLALFAREKSGRGQHIDVALLDCQIALLSFQAHAYFATGVSPGRIGNRHPSIVPYELFEVADGYLNVGVGNDRMWQRFCEAVERSDLGQDVRFSTNRLRVDNLSDLMAELTPLFKSRPAAAWTEVLDRAGIPAGPVLSVEQALNHPQVQARGMVVEREHPTLGPIKLLANPIKLSDTPAQVTAAPPLLGQHTHEVLCDMLGYSKTEVDAWVEAGVASCPR